MTTKEATMTREEALSKLAEVGKAMRKRFEDEHGTHEPRLQQLDATLAHARDLVGHLHDEEEREVDLARRLLDQEPVHNSHPVRPPTDRPKGWAATVAARGAK